MTDDEQASGNIEKAVIRKIVFRLFPLMIILTMVNFLDRNCSPSRWTSDVQGWLNIAEGVLRERAAAVLT